MASSAVDDDYLFQEALYLDPPPDDEVRSFLCPVCLCPIQRDAHLTDCCGKHFCFQCIRRIRESQPPRNSACPTCNASVFTIFPNKERQREINHLKVCCPRNLDPGEGGGGRRVVCQWTGQLGQVARHLQEKHSTSGQEARGGGVQSKVQASCLDSSKSTSPAEGTSQQRPALPSQSAQLSLTYSHPGSHFLGTLRQEASAAAVGSADLPQSVPSWVSDRDVTGSTNRSSRVIAARVLPEGQQAVSSGATVGSAVSSQQGLHAPLLSSQQQGHSSQHNQTAVAGDQRGANDPVHIHPPHHRDLQFHHQFHPHGHHHRGGPPGFRHHHPPPHHHFLSHPHHHPHRHHRPHPSHPHPPHPHPSHLHPPHPHHRHRGCPPPFPF